MHRHPQIPFALEVLLVSILILAAGDARAQTATTGAVQGVVTDAASGDPIAGVAIVAASPALQGTQTALTDDRGHYKISALPPGLYQLDFFYADLALQRTGIPVSLGKTAPVFVTLDSSQAGGEVIVIDGAPPAIDTTSTSQGATFDDRYLRHVPTPGRTFEGALGAAAGASEQALGPAFSGSSSLENQYIVDGLNTTELIAGGIGTSVVTEFIEELEVLTGGYGAEHGRATGAVVNVVTRSGSNELHGSVFGYASGAALVAGAETTPSESSSIDAVSNVVYDTDVGFELGGPLARDRLWFYVGLAPHLRRDDLTRITKRRTDCRQRLPDGGLSACDPRFADGAPDVSPDTGFLLYDDLDRATIPVEEASYPFVAKLNLAVAPEHQGHVSVLGTPIEGREIDVTGVPEATHLDVSQLTTDVAATWTSKLAGGATELQAVAGWHRTAFERSASASGANAIPRQNLYYGDLGTWSALGGESAATRAGCTDGGPDDPYPDIVNCPDEGVGYATGGPGARADDEQQRFTLRLSATQRVRAAGGHELEAGIDVEDNRLSSLRAYSGGAAYDVYVGSETHVYRFVDVAPAGTAPGFADTCVDTGSETSYACEFLGAERVDGRTINWAAYLRDSWQILPNLAINAGVRYEEQRVRYPAAVQGTTNAITGETYGKNAVVLDGMWAPRAGVVYDWTGEGRSKAYAHYGRFYESVPMSLNRINLGGETTFHQVFESDACGEPVMGVGGPDGPACLAEDASPMWATVGGSGILVAPGTRGQYLDEVVAGVDYALPHDTAVGVSYHHRWLGRVLEDVSPDNTATYVLANPGEWPAGEERRLEAQIARTGDPEERARLEQLLDVYRGIRRFDTPTRDYHAVRLTAVKRFAGRLFVQGSYTYSRTTGNFPGIYSPDSGFVAPNITGQYDLIELVANRDGRAPQDHPHALGIDGYYIQPLAETRRLITGGRLRARSGSPIDVLAASPVYGQDESFLLPRGLAGRTEIDAGLDLHLAYAHDLGRGTSLEVFADVFDLLNRQTVLGADETYTVDSVNPIVGGDEEDLLWAKTLDADGAETATPPHLNRNFTRPERRRAPLTVRLGARLTF